MNRLCALIYGAVSYLFFLAVFIYAILFVGDLMVPRTIDNAITAPAEVAAVVDLALLMLFAVQHSVMARPAFKRWWTRYVPQPIERSTYVLLASAVLALLCWQWRELAAVVWTVTWAPARVGLWALFWLGWAIVLASTFMISHFELFGLRQVFAAWRRKPQLEKGFQSALLYRLVRHPLNLGFLIAFWAAPTMTVGRLLFAATTTGWILLAMHLEERDLLVTLGAPYAAYRRRVPMLLPRLPRYRWSGSRVARTGDVAPLT
ncbi:MAG: methanethiol S-methyltransferase [Mycobacterium sp.]